MFQLHPQLAADTLLLGDWPLSQVLLMNDANYSWLVLVPRRAGIREVIDLALPDRALLWQEVDRASATMATVTQPDKINIGAIGNLVAQLHVHVVARRRSDPAWPRPVWGAAPAQPYAADRGADEVARWRRALGL